jgi:hypothetical protein
MFDQIKQFLKQHHISHAQLKAILTHESNARSDVEILKDTAQKIYSNSQTHSIPKTGLTGMADFLQDAFGFQVDASQGSRPGRHALTHSYVRHPSLAHLHCDATCGPASSQFGRHSDSHRSIEW